MSRADQVYLFQRLEDIILLLHDIANSLKQVERSLPNPEDHP